MVPTTACPIAIASRTAEPRPSVTELITIRSADFINDNTSSRKPGNNTRLASDNCLICRSSCGRSSPSPRITRCASGTSRSTNGIASIRYRCPLWPTSAPTLTITGTPCGNQYSACRSSRRPILNLLDVDPVVHDLDAPGGDAILHEDVLDRARGGDEAVDLPVFPLREGVRLKMKVDAPRGNDLRARLRRPERQAERRHRHRVRIVRVHDLRLPAADDLRQLPRGGEIDLVDRRKRKQVGALGGAPEQLAFRMRHQHGAVAPGPQAQHGQKDLLLSPAPGARGVDVEGEHSSQSLANFRPT